MAESQFQRYEMPDPNFQELGSKPPANVSSPSGTLKTLKAIVKVILWIGAVILLAPVALIVLCFAIMIFGSAFSFLPLVGTVSSAALLMMVVSRDNKNKRSNKYMSLFIFLGVFLFLLAAGQYNVQSLSCPLHFDYVSNLFIPLTPLMASLTVFKISKR
jgi:hypothetical protein